MSNLILVLNILTVAGLIVASILAVHFEKLLSAVIALGASGIFMAAEFLILHAPDVAISEAAVGAVLTPIIFMITLRKIKGRDDE